MRVVFITQPLNHSTEDHRAKKDFTDRFNHFSGVMLVQSAQNV
jgi:hypothetical protein